MWPIGAAEYEKIACDATERRRVILMRCRRVRSTLAAVVAATLVASLAVTTPAGAETDTVTGGDVDNVSGDTQLTAGLPEGCALAFGDSDTYCVDLAGDLSRVWATSDGGAGLDPIVESVFAGKAVRPSAAVMWGNYVVAAYPGLNSLFALRRDVPQMIQIGGSGRTGWGRTAERWTWRPRDLAVGPDGSLYVLDDATRQVFVVDPDDQDAPWDGTIEPLRGSRIDSGELTAIAVSEVGLVHVATRDEIWRIDGLADAPTQVASPGGSVVSEYVQGKKLSDTDFSPITDLAAGPGEVLYVATNPVGDTDGGGFVYAIDRTPTACMSPPGPRKIVGAVSRTSTSCRVRTTGCRIRAPERRAT